MSAIDGINSVIQARQDQAYAAIGIAVLRKGLDAMQLQGEAAVQLIQASTEIAKQLGKGLHFDAHA